MNSLTRDGVSPLTVSIFKSNWAVTEQLLARPELAVQSGSSSAVDPLQVAAARGRPDLVTRLIR